MTQKFSDDRGTLFFPIKENAYNFSQCTVSMNKKNVFRGFHVNNFDKLVTCVQGKILDIVINLDPLSSEYLIPKYYNLDPSTDFFQILVPKDHAHGFFSLKKGSILMYHFNGFFTEENTKHIYYLDPCLKLKLPIEENSVILSKKDSMWQDAMECAAESREEILAEELLRFFVSKELKELFAGNSKLGYKLGSTNRGKKFSKETIDF